MTMFVLMKETISCDNRTIDTIPMAIAPTRIDLYSKIDDLEYDHLDKGFMMVNRRVRGSLHVQYNEKTFSRHYYIETVVDCTGFE